MIKRIFILVIFSLVPFLLAGQASYTTQSRKAIAKFDAARQQYTLRNFDAAVENLHQAMEADPEFIEAYLLLGEVHMDANHTEKAIDAFQGAVDIDPYFFPNALFYLGENEFSIGRYIPAKNHLRMFLESSRTSKEMRLMAIRRLEYCDFAIYSMTHPVPFEPVSLGAGINSAYDEYWPSLSADEAMMVFTVLLPIDESNPGVIRNRQEDFFYSIRENGEWQQAINAGSPLNTPDNEGAQSITGDGGNMFFTACGRADGLGLCDIYYSEQRGEQWTNPVNLGSVINSKYSEKQPSVSSDGRMLYFTSNRPGGKGGYDIWMSRKSEDGSWQEPVNLGDSVNTEYADQSPFIHPDNKTLYFSSSGWPGMGAFDLFFTRRTSDSTYSRPVNLGYPINTWHQEEGMIVNARGDKAYFSSNRLSDQGRDIFEFDLYPKARPVKVSFMKGKVYDGKSGKALSAKFELIDLATSSVIMDFWSKPGSGEFLVCIPTDADYALNVSKTDYLFYSDNFTMEKVFARTEPYLMDIPLQAIEVGQSIVLKNIFFRTDSYELDDKSRVELEKLTGFLNSHPDMQIEISGHTDNTGTAAYNQDLSERRAGAVVDYLVQKKISAERIKSKGYGLSQPIAGNDTEEGKAGNRRTEMKILKK